MMASIQKYQATDQGTSSMDSIEPASLLEANLKAGVTSETHLQSLGFVVDNGRPRFRIDAPVGNAAGLESLKSGLATLRLTPNPVDSEEESFVVLGKDSLSSIQASSLASLVQIQQKSMSTDYNSMLSSLTAEETERKLKELLQENVKLKETLSQNNLAMKQQFNTLAAWQEEIMKVHQSHKQKFSETKELINQLRKENSELRIKASTDSVATSDYGQKLQELEAQLEKTLLAQKAVQSAKELELEESNSKLTKELDASKTACKMLTSDIHRQTDLSTRLSQQLKQADQTIERLKLDIEKLELNLKENERLTNFADFSLLYASSQQTQESEMWKEKSQRQEKEIKHFQELINSLEQQVNINGQISFPSVEIQTSDTCSRLPSKDRLQFIKNVKQYNDILQKLSESYAKQGTSYINVQETLKELIDIIQDFEKIKSSEYSGVGLQEKLDKLANCRAKLNHDRLEMINERQELIKAQNQFQKVFSDYNSVLYELEIMHEENAKLSCLQNETNEAAMQQESPETLAEMRKKFARDKELLENEKATIMKDKYDIIGERKAKEELQSECENLRKAVNQLKLFEEATQKVFLAEKKNLQETLKDLKTKNESLGHIVKSNLKEIDRLKAEIKSLTEEAEKIPILQAQLNVYLTDFEEERQARTVAMEEKNKLIDQLQKLQKLHMDLVATLEGEQSKTTPQQQHATASAPLENDKDWEVIPATVITAFSCPKCSLSFTALRPLEEHVEKCLELQ